MRKMKSNQQAYHKSLYSEAILQKAIHDYRNLATITLSDEGDNYLCIFCDCIVVPERVIHEFDNYLIELINAQGEKA